MGMGVAGSYLMARLRDTEHQAVGYERSTGERHDSICAWGTIRPVLEEFCKKTGRDFGDFVIHDGRQMDVKMSSGVEFGIGLHGPVHLQQAGTDQGLHQGHGRSVRGGPQAGQS